MTEAVRHVGAISISVCILMGSMTVCAEEDATTTRDYLNSVNAGVTNIMEPSGMDSEQSRDAMDELAAIAVENAPEEEEELSTLFMANVNNSLNVRTEPDAESERAGLLYKDCGGRILERGDEWTRIQSGDLVGWVSNEYLLKNV